jgi:hypothetical protein
MIVMQIFTKGGRLEVPVETEEKCLKIIEGFINLIDITELGQKKAGIFKCLIEKNLAGFILCQNVSEIAVPAKTIKLPGMGPN